ncbi:bifunctional RNase H/acid phosphatase [Polymorphospora rubra]|uniref:Bifunctional RNase H/acid phosphatase n=1 Tax=Polymorphospora rubra TaxID=338584 RepID=A0A810MRI8_9ACTN|nr:bifunctional RNase H/acid phosphatase [Polymorphospora rubra]BCJ63542.1 bifunctional RNase H/acid phosphatase [Polymorphospora rubra]
MTGGPKVVVEADGGARGNPGPAGFGAVVRDAGTGEVLAERAEAIGVATNNVAEYRGLLAGLEAAAEVGASAVDVRMDSKLVVEQMSGRWQIKNPGLRPLAAQAATLVRRFDSVTFGWIPRERNKHADGLANAAMDRAAGKPARGPAGAVVTAAEPGAVGPARAAAPVPGAAAGGLDEEARQVAGPDSAARAQAREVAARAAAKGGAARPTWEPRPASTATRLVLLRHGETDFTAQRRYSGRGDVPLSERGRAQVAAAADRIARLVGDTPVTAVVTSPLSRCTATAEAVAATLGGPPVVVEPDLIEVDFGAWEGRTFAEVRERWPAELDRWLASVAVAPPGGESFAAVTKRVRRVVAGLLSTYPGGTVVVVSHVSPVKILLRDALAAGDAFLHRLHLDPAGLSVVDTWPDGNVSVRTVNDTAHLR